MDLEYELMACGKGGGGDATTVTLWKCDGDRDGLTTHETERDRMDGLFIVWLMQYQSCFQLGLAIKDSSLFG